ncbi:MAG TPA: tetratricopeptide repeat protein [Anaeromyxobacteraceae bacterium]|nr:tetratricopeptide repeat protein [Anaeromyxobacteraceae bacterium]
MSSRKARKSGNKAPRSNRRPPISPAPPPRPEADARSRWLPWGVLAILLAGAALGYAPALHGAFHWDDWTAIQDNMRLRDPATLHLPTPAEMLGPVRIVSEIVFALDYRAVGLQTLRYHVVSLVFHLVASALAFVFARSLLRRVGHPRAVPIALFAAGAFALHPMQSQAVAYAAQRSEVLASLFYLVCLLFLADAAARPLSARAAASWGGGLVSWLLAMGSKSIAITAPAAFVMEQAVTAPASERGGPALRRRAGRALALAAPILALAAWSASLQLAYFATTPQGGVGTTNASALSPFHYFLTQLRVQWLYLRLLAWPDALCLDRSFVPSRGFDGAVGLAAAGAAAALALATWLWVRAERAQGPAPAERIGAFGIYWWFLLLAPTSSIIPVVDLAVEHRVYLASLGPILAVAGGADAALERLLPPARAGRAGAALGLAVLLALGVALGVRAGVWSTEESLWRDAASKSPGNARILTNLGLALQQKGDMPGAEKAYREAWAVVKEPLHLVHLSRNFAALLELTGRPAEALTVLDRGLALSSTHPDLLVNRAVALTQLGRVDEALVTARRAAELAPGAPLIRNAYGQVLAYHGDWAPSLAEFRAAASLDPGSPAYFANQALPLAGLGHKAEACAVLEQAKARFGASRLPKEADRWWTGIGCSR